MEKFPELIKSDTGITKSELESSGWKTRGGIVSMLTDLGYQTSKLGVEGSLDARLCVIILK